MKEYFTALFITVSVSCVLSVICYKGKGERGVKGAFMIIILYAAILPLGNLISSDDEISGGSFDIGDYTEDYIGVCEAAFTDGVKDLLCSTFALDPSEVYIRVIDFDFETVSCSEIRVVLSGRASLADRYKIEEYVSKNGLGGCRVEVRIG